jgi:hypothetical protein
MAAGARDQASETVKLVAVEPRVDRVGLARLEQALDGDAVGRPAGRDLEDGRGPLAQVRTPIGVPDPLELGPLGGAQG